MAIERLMTATATEVRVFSPFPVEAIPRIGFWFERVAANISDDFGPKTVDDVVRLVQGHMSNGIQTWAVERDGELGGYISAFKLSPIVKEISCTFKPEFFTPNTVDPAIKEVLADLFSDGTLKVVAHIFKENYGIRNVVKRLGFTFEGNRRKHTMRGGRLVDVQALGITKEDFDLCSVS